MKDQQMPDWLTETLSMTESYTRTAETQAPAEIRPGDVCVVYSSTRSDAVGRLLLARHAEDGWCDGMLISAETELATEVDAILPREQTRLGYRVAVHSRFHGPIWITQIARRVGAVDPDVLDDIERLARYDEADVDLVLGMPLQPKGIDPRYPALEALFAELKVLTNHCRRLRYDLSPPVLDPYLAEIHVFRQLLTEPGWEIKLANAVSTPDFQDRLLASLRELSKTERRGAMLFIERALHCERVT